MPRMEKQKLKIPYLMKIFESKTDESHGISMAEIISELGKQEIHAERKAIYNDIDYLNEFGFEIESQPVGKGYEYRHVSRLFELAELKLLVDSVQSSKFITEKKSREIIKKLETLCSEYEAKQINRQVYVQGRVKSMNESVLYNVDNIHTAISTNCKLQFKYCNWNIKKQMEPRHGGKPYKVSPWGLAWDNENYYMVAFDEEYQEIRHYRVDKMTDINIIDERREGQNSYKGINMAEYSKSIFGMFSGEVRTVSIECRNDMVGVMIDRFGKDISIIRVDDDHFRINVSVAVSGPFFGWIIGLGDGVRITGPDDVVDKMKAEAKRLSEQYC